MSRYIDADLYVEMQIYDEEHEERRKWKGTIEDLLDQWTEQGCPPTVEHKTGEWKWSALDCSWECSRCNCVFEEFDYKPEYNYCPNCGADMRGEEE